MTTGAIVEHKNSGIEVETIESFPLGGGGDDAATIMWLLTKVAELEGRIAVLEARDRGLNPSDRGRSN